MSRIASLILEREVGSLRRPGVVAAVISAVGLVNQIRESRDTSERIKLALEMANVFTDLTATATDDEFVAIVEKYVNTPEAVALFEAALAYWKSLSQKTGAAVPA